MHSTSSEDQRRKGERKAKREEEREGKQRRLLVFFTSFEYEKTDDSCVTGHRWQSSITCKGLFKTHRCTW